MVDEAATKREEREMADTKREQDKEFEGSTSLGTKCAECGLEKEKHALVNYADGPNVGASFLVCPTATFTPYR
jgi:hypothetical protein